MSRRTVQLRRVMRQAKKGGQPLLAVLPHPNSPDRDCHTHVKRWDGGELRLDSPRPGSRKGTREMEQRKIEAWERLWNDLEKGKARR